MDIPILKFSKISFTFFAWMNTIYNIFTSCNNELHNEVAKKAQKKGNNLVHEVTTKKQKKQKFQQGSNVETHRGLSHKSTKTLIKQTSVVLNFKILKLQRNL